MNIFLKSLFLMILVSLLINNSQINAQRIFPTDCDESDWFGFCVDISGDYAIVGSPMEEEKGYNSGGAYVYKNSNGTWELDSKIMPEDLTEGDFFGWSVAIDGDYAIVGAPYQVSSMGMAYIFKRVDGIWDQQDKVSDNIYGNNFGWSVAIHGDRAAVGATGAAYVFTRNEDESWSEEGSIIETNEFVGLDFGRRVSLYDNYLVVASAQDDEVGLRAGAAYVYRIIDATGWQFHKKLMPSDGGDNDAFGTSVEISEKYIAVGSYAHMISGINTGAVYIYDRNYELNEQTKFVAEDASYWHNFGHSLSISNDYILVGARNATASYIFNYDGIEWKQYSKISPEDISNNKSYGCSVSLEGSNLLIGACEANANGNASGAAFFYNDMGIVEVETDKLNTPNEFLLSQNYPNPF
ncbi:MAG: FG-GAP repeat protein, partial [Melioribacteraceae bacterium]|nr:FG-GAP repeat protein [Melioribacteraceae bacterium]